VIYHIPKKLRKKLDKKGRIGVLLGYDPLNTKAYLVIDVESKNIVRTSDCTFFENEFPFKTRMKQKMPKMDTSITVQYDSDSDSDSDDGDEESDEDQNPTQIQLPDSDSDDFNDFDENPTQIQLPDLDSDCFEDPCDEAEPPPRRSARNKTISSRLRDYEIAGFAGLVNIPTTIREVMQSSEKDKWEEAMEQEYQSLLDNNTWEVVDRPDNIPVIKSKWIFQKKLNSDGTIKRYKARFVAKGFSQIHGINYDQVYSPTASMALLRLMVAIAVSKDWSIYQGDVKTAFLASKLDEDIYVELPEGIKMNVDTKSNVAK